MIKNLIILVGIFFTASALAGQSNCRPIEKSMCHNCLTPVRCSDGKGGNFAAFLPKHTPVSEAHIVIISKNGYDRIVKVKVPGTTSYDYEPGRISNKVKGAIPRIKPSDQIEVIATMVGNNTTLYKDNRGKKAHQGSITELIAEHLAITSDCIFANKPAVINDSRCSSKVCSGNVICTHTNSKDPYGKILRFSAHCRTIKGDSCPSAVECVMDDRVKYSYATDADYIHRGIRDSDVDLSTRARKGLGR